ncbi:FtsX-like permease family protein [Nesterenkonia halotolerans]|uniref:ABC transport system permease protein n=1 Tax=Nesterenkonia halotolerans TaxID=225325 RepID=A0ABR9J786_9MICC|nr:ABC transporter permease [Nesterenkonia halotolerans]MBE1514860.1 putative ABC transport system permease protein [Nesterenkonia halotolerans]
MRRNPVLQVNLRSAGKKLFAAGAAVAISVAFIVAGMLMVDSFNRGLTQQIEAEAAGSDLIIDTAMAMTWDEDTEDYLRDDVPLAEEIDELDGVDVADAVSGAYLSDVEEDGSATIGLPVTEQSETREGEISAGREAQAQDEVVVSSAAAEGQGIELGTTLTAQEFVYEEGAAEDAEPTVIEEDYTVVGVMDTQGSPRGFVTPEGMERVPAGGSPVEIRVKLSPEGEATEVQEQIRGLIDEAVAGLESTRAADLGSLEVRTIEEIVETRMAEQTGSGDALGYFALGFGGISVFVSALVISNTFQVLVASRQRTLALLRAVGATSAQLKRATLMEGAVLGLLGGAAGVVLGTTAALGFSAIARATFAPDLPLAGPTLLATVVGLGLGLLVTVFSALLPALKAGRVSPMAALRPAGLGAAMPKISILRVSIGLVLTLGGFGAVLAAALLGGPEGSLPVPAPLLGVAGAALGFSGVLVLARIAVPGLVAQGGRLLARIPGLRVNARLAGQNARQVPGRTTATASALLVGVTLVGTMMVGASTAQTVLYDELAERYPVEASVAAVGEDLQADLTESDLVESFTSAQGTSATLTGELGSAEGRVVLVDEETFAGVARVGGLAPAPGQALVAGQLNGEVYSGSGAELELMPYGTASSGAEEQAITVEASIASWLPGDTVLITAESLPEEALAEEGSPWTFSDAQGITLIRVAEGVSPDESYGLASLMEDHSEQFNDEGAVMRASYSQSIDMVLLIVLVLLGASVLVAVIGVSNTLSLSVLERRREAALLRAVGMNRRSVGQMITIEALLLAGVALLIGTALGAFLGWAGVASMVAREDWSVVLEMPWLRIAGLWAVTLLAAGLAAMLPARALSKVEPAAGLSED